MNVESYILNKEHNLKVDKSKDEIYHRYLIKALNLKNDTVLNILSRGGIHVKKADTIEGGKTPRYKDTRQTMRSGNVFGKSLFSG